MHVVALFNTIIIVINIFHSMHVMLTPQPTEAKTFQGRRWGVNYMVQSLGACPKHGSPLFG